jgi:DNA-binding MarR family transcriptional regulator
VSSSPDDNLAEAFWAVARRMRHQTREVLAPLDVTPAQSRAIGVLSRHGDLRLSELAEHLRIAARSATEVVDDLETRGLAGRRPDPADRRATLVALTESGQAAAAAVEAARRAFFTDLSTADQAELARILRLLGS